ncbi:MAG: NTP transferase domain-containing protein [Desulfobacterales bacterium]|nr:NTP transferase domain-containing protein [Desulfobacterales bacterium]MBF0398252.1 NTP transferase domain-containing protein [Desulfobacterales bacterium]
MPTDIAIIACAGRGSRLGHTIPKSCVEVGGKTLLQWQLEALEDFNHVVIVVGYRRNFVIDELFAHRKNATIVINDDWNKTNTAYSISLACGLYHENQTVLTIDGDTLFEKKDIQGMNQDELAIGVTSPMSDEGVFVDIDHAHYVTGFTRERNTGHEWSGMALLKAGFFHKRPDSFVYEVIQKYLPIKAKRINLLEIDTPDDLEKARIRIKSKKSETAGKI